MPDLNASFFELPPEVRQEVEALIQRFESDWLGGKQPVIEQYLPAEGPGRLGKDGSREPLQVKVGDTVLFTNWAGDEFKRGQGENVLLLREEDVLAVLE